VAVTGIVPLNRQIVTMAADYPMLKVVERTPHIAIWRGPLKPLFMTFEVEIAYRVPTVIELIDPRRQQPQVRVLRPPLRYRKTGEEGPLPHVYWDRDDQPILCLFDPDGSQWTPMDLLTETTVKWTIDWLVCYEGWRATGEWTGGGRHVAPVDQKVPS
jgi:hypothetical protein